MFNLDNYKIVLEFVADLEKIGTDVAKSVIDTIDTGASTHHLMDQVERGMRLIFETHGFEYYMKYENSFQITIFWCDKDTAFYINELKKIKH